MVASEPERKNRGRPGGRPGIRGTTRAERLAKRNGACTPPEEAFCRLLAFEGTPPARAYRIVWRCAVGAGKTGAYRVLTRPHVRERLKELQHQAMIEAAKTLPQRREALAKIVDAGTTPHALKRAHPSDAINAIREDAILAGERRTDGTQVNISAEISINQVLAHLRGGEVEAKSVQDATPVDVTHEIQQVASEAGEAHNLVRAGSTPAPASTSRSREPVGAPCGPLGPVRVNAQSQADRPAGANLGAQEWESDE